MADVVEREDVNEAMRLMEMSKQSLYDDEQSSRWVWPCNQDNHSQTLLSPQEGSSN